MWPRISLAAGLLLGVGSANAQLPWKELHPGPYAVGYRVIFAFDPSRTWRTTRPYGGAFTPDTQGRPVRVSVWYPAAPGSRRAMTMADYLAPRSPARFRDANADLERRDRRVLAEMAPPDAFDALLGTRMHAALGTAPASGQFPLVLYSGGVNSYTLSNAIMAEVLASHGYVVATVPSLGPSDEQPEQPYTADEIEAAVRDLQFAWSLLRHDSMIAPGKLAVFGHSLGGSIAMLFALRNADVSAAIGLDGTYGFASSDTGTITQHFGYTPQHMRAAILDIHRGGTTLDLSAIDRFRYAERSYITMPDVLHGDFTTFVVVARAFQLPMPQQVSPGVTRETGYLGYRRTCELLLAFLDEKLKGDGDARRHLQAVVDSTPRMTFRRSDPIAAPPSAGELVALLTTRGVDSAMHLIDQLRRDEPDETIVDAREANSLGYSLIGEHRYTAATGILLLTAHAYPQSANAEDSLGDAYLAAGDIARARAAYAEALRLISGDRGLDAEQKATLTKIETDHLATLPP
jgi:alpha-beta hydrolase superfamily lysophospholipase